MDLQQPNLHRSLKIVDCRENAYAGNRVGKRLMSMIVWEVMEWKPGSGLY